MKDKQFIFLAGLHRSGTSLLHEIMRSHPDVSGFHDTGVPEDEGQHLQSVYEPGMTFGGPGKFAFDKKAYMDETHPLATPENANKLFEQWSRHYNLDCHYLIEKSPPNIIRTRFLQKLFPTSKFIVILRHPVAVAYATQKWSKTSIASLLEHTLLAYELFFKDIAALNHVYLLRYEEFVTSPQKTIDILFNYAGLTSTKIDRDIKINVNEKYFKRWEDDKKNDATLKGLASTLESRALACGYRLNDVNQLVSVSWLGEHKKA